MHEPKFVYTHTKHAYVGWRPRMHTLKNKPVYTWKKAAYTWA